MQQTPYLPRPKTMAEALTWRPEPKPKPKEPKPDLRGKSKHWTTHEFRAVFVGFVWRYDRRTMRQSRQAVLKDVYMNGKLLTLNWTVDCPPTLARLCTAPGCEVRFMAEFSRTAYECKVRNQPLLRVPFRPVVEMSS